MLSAELEVPSGGKFVLEPPGRSGNRLSVEGFDPCVVLLNNDLSAGVPLSWRDWNNPCSRHCMGAGSDGASQITSPPIGDVSAPEFAGLVGLDPWLITPYFEKCGTINFQEHQGEDCLEEYVAEILDAIRAKYREYGISQEPFVIVKADAGTYGMGIMTAKTPADVRGLNRKQRNRMAVVKEGLEVHEVLVQEGVYTFESVNDAVAEPVVYMIDQFVVGGFYRVHTERGPDQNLNAPGMRFEPLAFAAPCSSPDPDDPAVHRTALCAWRDRAPRARGGCDRT